MCVQPVRLKDGGVLPHINFILPVSLLAPLFEFLETPHEPDALARLIEDCCDFGAVW